MGGMGRFDWLNSGVCGMSFERDTTLSERLTNGQSLLEQG